MNPTLLDILSRGPDGWVVAVANSSLAVIEGAANGKTVLTVPAADSRKVCGTWSRGPIQALVIDRAEVGDDPTDALYWTLHIPTMGVLALVGWAAGDPHAPPIGAYRRDDGRVWAPLVCRDDVLSWVCVGAMTDA